MKVQKNEGFTIIELVITLAILGIVISLGFSFFSFGNNTFSKGQSQSSIQHTVRMASRYITDEIRTSKDITLLSEKPETFGDFNYIYTEGTKILHRKPDGTIQEIYGSSDEGLITLNFLSDEDREVEFIITKIINDQSYEVQSSVSTLNLLEADTVLKDSSLDASWRAIEYSDPITDDEAIVRLDTLLLDFHELNAFLNVEGDTFVLDVPTKRPNRVNLPLKGEIGADISWSSNQINLGTGVNDRGIIYRPRADETDVNLVVTATISKGEEVRTKDFDLTIKKLEPLTFDSDTLSFSVQSGTPFTHLIAALGGNPGYSFSSTSLPEGITLSSDGTISGQISLPEGSTSSYVLTIPSTVTDMHYDTGGNLSPNTETSSITIIVE